MDKTIGTDVVYPIAQEFPTVAKQYRPPGYEATYSATLSASFRRGGLEPLVTVLALVEGFGPGWSAEEVCELALGALRERFLQGEDGAIPEIVLAGLLAANEAVYERASEYNARGDIGGRLVIALMTGGRCYAIQVGEGVAFLREREGGFRQIDPILTAPAGAFLGADAVLDMIPSEDQSGIRLMPGDLLVLMNAALLAGLAPVGDELARRLACLPMGKVADLLLELGQAGAPGRALSLLSLETPGVVRRVAALMPRLSRPSVLLGAGALALVTFLFWIGIDWLDRPDPTPTSPTLSPIPTATIFLAPPATDLPRLPTPERSATPIPTPTDTATPTSTPIESPTPVPPTGTPTATPTPSPSLTSTPTPVPPTPTPTVPVGPIEVGGVVVVTGTEGFGVSARIEPLLAADRLFILYDGEQLWVIAGPEIVGDSTWWRLRAASGAEGWVVERFLQGVAIP